jgi:hypothetical protein
LTESHAEGVVGEELLGDGGADECARDAGQQISGDHPAS